MRPPKFDRRKLLLVALAIRSLSRQFGGCSLRQIAHLLKTKDTATFVRIQRLVKMRLAWKAVDTATTLRLTPAGEKFCEGYVLVFEVGEVNVYQAEVVQ